MLFVISKLSIKQYFAFIITDQIFMVYYVGPLYFFTASEDSTLWKNNSKRVCFTGNSRTLCHLLGGVCRFFRNLSCSLDGVFDISCGLTNGLNCNLHCYPFVVTQKGTSFMPKFISSSIKVFFIAFLFKVMLN